MGERQLRNAFGAFPTGVTVVTTVDAQGTCQGVTANSFSSLSLQPPLVLWSQALVARSFPAFRDAAHFVINILASDQLELSRRFAASGTDKFAGLALQYGRTGLPALPGCCAWLECRKVAMHPGGDHMIHVGEVLAFEHHERPPLLFFQGRYGVALEYEGASTAP